MSEVQLGGRNEAPKKRNGAANRRAKKLLRLPRNIQAKPRSRCSLDVRTSWDPLPPSDRLCSPSPSSSKISICSSAKAAPHSPISPPSNCTLLQLLSFHLQTSHTSLNMFRNALRQSTRAVGAVSAAGRVAAVSRFLLPRPGIRLEPTAIKQRLETSCIHREPVLGAQLGCYIDASALG